MSIRHITLTQFFEAPEQQLAQLSDDEGDHLNLTQLGEKSYVVITQDHYWKLMNELKALRGGNHGYYSEVSIPTHDEIKALIKRERDEYLNSIRTPST